MLRLYKYWLEVPKAIIIDQEELEAKSVSDQSVSFSHNRHGK